MKIIQSPSPNFSNSTYKKIGVQIHKTLGLMPYALTWLQNPRAQVSAHYLITKLGEIHQLVQLNKRSWSAGRINRPSERAKKIMKKYLWGFYVQPGHYLIQIEFECLLEEDFNTLQYEAATWLMQQWDFKVMPEYFLEHQDTAIDKMDLYPQRKEILNRLALATAPVVPPPVVPPSNMVDKEEFKLKVIEAIKKL